MADYLAAKAVIAGLPKRRCPCCEQLHFIEGPPISIAALTTQGDAKPAADAADALVYICTGCGFMRLHSLEVLEERAQVRSK